MSETLLESLSAAVDDEAEELELRRALNAARDDDELRAKWWRLHAAGAVMRGGAPGAAARVRLSATEELPWLADAAQTSHRAEPEPPARQAARSSWLMPFAGVGVAAAAALAVVVFFGSSDDAAAPAPAVAQTDASDTGAAVMAREPATGLAQVPSELDLRRVDAYMAHHAQQTSLTHRTPGMPFVKVLTATGVGDQEPR